MKKIPTIKLSKYLSAVKSYDQILISSSALTGAINISAIILSFVVAILLARTLGPEKYGEYLYIVSVVIFGSLLSQWGLKNYAILKISSCADENHVLAQFFINSVCLIAIVSSLYVLVSLIFIPESNYLHCAILGVPLIALSGLISGILRGMGKGWKAFVHDVLIRPASICCLLLALFYFGIRIDIREALIIFISATVFSLIYGLVFLKRSSNVVFGGEGKRSEIAALTVSAFPMLGITLLSSFQDTIYPFVVMHLAGSDQVSVYKIVIQAGALMSFSILTFSAIAMPKISEKIAQGLTGDVEIISRQSSWISIFVMLPILIIVLAYGEVLIVTAFGKEYIEAALIFQIFAIFRFGMMGLGLPGQILMMSGYSKLVTKVMAIQSLVVVSIMLVLSSYFGAFGSVIGLAISELIFNSLLVFLVSRKLSINCTIITFLDRVRI